MYIRQTLDQGRVTVQLPVVIGGEVLLDSGADFYELEYDTGAICRIPRLSQAHLDRMVEQEPLLLAELPLQDIVNFLRKVGRFWDYNNSQHPLCKSAVEAMAALNGYNLRMAQREMNVLSVICSFGEALHDLVDAELGNRFYLEEWLPNHDAYVKAVPFGRIVHILVGNVPVSSAMSLVRSLLTKNSTVAKLPRRDPITALAFVLSCITIDPDHPVTRSLTALYWKPGSKDESCVLATANAICVWGGENTISSVRNVAPADAEILMFGPKRSISLVGRESSRSARVAQDLAHDISINDQEACFSPQIVYVEGDNAEFSQLLSESLQLYAELLPVSTGSLDDHARVQSARLAARFQGQNTKFDSDGTNWTVIRMDDPRLIGEHPLRRVIYVVSVQSISDALCDVDRNTQTITISPWGRNTEIRDKAALLGASKITEIGLAEWQRIGVPHDGLFPMARMVRWVGLERGLNYLGKTIEFGPVDTTKWLMMSDALPPDSDGTPRFE